MKIAIINRSDLNGGAAVFTYRLTEAFRNNGIDATMLVTDKRSDTDFVVSYAHSLKDRYAFLAERLQIFLQNGFSKKNLFKVDTADFGRDISSHPAVKEADVIILNWINQGALSLDCVKRLCNTGKPILWNMHDMWVCTGICHHAYECGGYKASCGKCAYLGSSCENDLSHKTWTKKKAVYSVPNIHFVAVSNWLADKCRESSLLAGKDICVIPNTIAVDNFSHHRKPNSDYNIPADRKVLAMGAARLDDDVKGFPLLIDALKQLSPDTASKVHLLLFGGLRNKELLNELAVPYTYLGAVTTDKVADILTHSDVILSSSLYESFGGTLIEGLASGCLAVTYGNGGQTDIVDHKRTGYIAEHKSTTDFAKGIEWAINENIDRSLLHQEMQQRFSPKTIVEKYLNLIETVK